MRQWKDENVVVAALFDQPMSAYALFIACENLICFEGQYFLEINTIFDFAISPDGLAVGIADTIKFYPFINPPVSTTDTVWTPIDPTVTNISDQPSTLESSPSIAH